MVHGVYVTTVFLGHCLTSPAEDWKAVSFYEQVHYLHRAIRVQLLSFYH